MQNSRRTPIQSIQRRLVSSGTLPDDDRDTSAMYCQLLNQLKNSRLVIDNDRRRATGRPHLANGIHAGILSDHFTLELTRRYTLECPDKKFPIGVNSNDSALWLHVVVRPSTTFSTATARVSS